MISTRRCGLKYSSLVLCLVSLALTWQAQGTLLQVHGLQRRWESSRGAATCAALTNRGSHSTVQIEVGTPEDGTEPQLFDVVADTGSDSVIVTSCLCVESGHCGSQNDCFTGPGHSSTFRLSGNPGNLVTAPVNGARSVVITFGSGKVQAVIATDIVKVGSLGAKLPDGVLLMVNQALDIDGPFEGILGLGQTRKPIADPLQHKWRPFRSPSAGDEEEYQPVSFLQAAGVSQFSMCFNSGRDGVLRLGEELPTPKLPSVGTYHWGLDFRGVSLGDDDTPLGFCDSSKMLPGQETPCGAIPDSGTTAIMGESSHISALFSRLCTDWAFCAKQAKFYPQFSKADLFQALLYNCSSWFDEEGGLSQLPSIKFHVRGADGRDVTLSLDPETYIVQMMANEVQYVTEKLFGLFPVIIERRTGKTAKVCVAAFAPQDYVTEKNGPVWIFGTPFFYQYRVGYDMSTDPPSMSFSDDPCGQCDQEDREEPALVSTDDLEHGKGLAPARQKRSRQHQPRELRGPLRMPTLDRSLPL